MLGRWSGKSPGGGEVSQLLRIAIQPPHRSDLKPPSAVRVSACQYPSARGQGVWLGYGPLENFSWAILEKSCEAASPAASHVGCLPHRAHTRCWRGSETPWASWEKKGSAQQLPVSLPLWTGRMQRCGQETECPQGCLMDRWGAWPADYRTRRRGRCLRVGR